VSYSDFDISKWFKNLIKEKEDLPLWKKPIKKCRNVNRATTKGAFGKCKVLKSQESK